MTAHQLPDDGEAEARPAIAVDDAVVGLREGVEDAALRLGRDADAGVDDVDLEHQPAIRPLALAHADRHAAMRRELHRVAAEVQQHLLELLLRADQPQRKPRADPDMDEHALGLRLHRQDAPHLVEAGGEIERGDADRLLAGLDAREVEDVVDQAQQRAAGIADHRRHLGLLAVEPPEAQQVGERDDRVERRAQLVADAGEEHALGLARLLRLLLGLRQLADQHGDIDGSAIRPISSPTARSLSRIQTGVFSAMKPKPTTARTVARFRYSTPKRKPLPKMIQR